jgi:ferredoxin-NADP reductase
MLDAQPITKATWTDDEVLECVSVLPESPNVVTVCFQAPSGRPFHFRAGQFLTLELPLPDGPLYRTYTISSSPTRPQSITITIKAQSTSLGTRWIIDNLRPGMTLKAKGPAGRFTSTDHPAKKYLFISAGSGITPMMSMTTEIYDLGRDCDIVFVSCARRPSEIIFKSRLEHMASRIQGLQLKWVVKGADTYQPWTGFEGRLNQLMLGLMAPDYLEREVFCCGPQPFMQSVAEALAGLGFDMSRFHQEDFHSPELALADPVGPAPGSEAVSNTQAEIVFEGSGVTRSCSETDTILVAARAAGIALPYGCSMGVCGTCRVKKISGEVHMVHNGGISEEEIDEGYILACCSNPREKVVLDL